jgi:hypothetical protein
MKREIGGAHSALPAVLRPMKRDIRHGGIAARLKMLFSVFDCK